MKYFNVFLTALVGFNSYIQAGIIDQGNTLVTVESSPTDLTAFNVTLVRSDKLLDDGSLIAARSVSMVFQFHIQDNKLHYKNDLVPKIGEKPKVTSVKATFVRDGIDPTVAEALFSEGIVSVEISSKIENTLVANKDDPEQPLIFGRHITLHEKILELDGNKIRQSDIFEHVIDLDRNGTVVRVISDPILAKQVTIAVEDDSEASSPSALSSCQELFQSIDIGSVVFQFLVYGFSIFLVVAVLKLLFLARQSYLRRTVAYQAVESSDFPPSYNDKDAAIFSSDVKNTESLADAEEADKTSH